MEGSKDNIQAVSLCQGSSSKCMKRDSRNIFRYASLYFVCGVDKGDNELITLEVSSPLLNPTIFVYSVQVIHEFVEALDRYFGNVFCFCYGAWANVTNFVQVCELDLIFNFHKAYYILDEVLLCGEQQETSKKIVLRVIAAQVSFFISWNSQLHLLCTLRVHVFLGI
jgi:hypothetical protein